MTGLDLGVGVSSLFGRTQWGGGDFFPQVILSDTDDPYPPFPGVPVVTTEAEIKAYLDDGSTRIGVAAGKHLRLELNLDAYNGIRIEGVGDLVTNGLPILDASDVIEGTWDDSTDRADANTNVYSQTLSWAGGTATFPNAWEDDAAYKAVANVATCQSTPGSFTTANGVAQDTNGTSVVFYIHPYSSTNPNSDGKAREIAKRQYALKLGNNTTAKNIWTRKQTHGNGSFMAGVDCLAENMLFSDGVKHEALMNSGMYRRCVAWHPNHDLRTNNIMMEFYISNGAGLTGVYDTCVCVGPGAVQDVNVTTQVCDAFTGHTSGVLAEYYDSVQVNNCSAKWASICVNNQADVVEVRNFYALNCATLSSNALSVCDGVWWHADTAILNQGRIVWAGSPTVTNMRVYLGGTAEFIGFQGNPSITLENSVFWFNTNDDFQSVVNNLTTSVSISECIFVLEGFRHSPVNLNAGPTYSASNNTWYETTSDRFRNRVAGTTYTGIAAYLTAFPDAGALTTNPNLADPANGDFSLAAPLSNGAGLLTFPEYTPIPADLTAAEAWIVAGA